MHFAYEAINAAGARLGGVQVADTMRQARAALESNGLLVINVRRSRRAQLQFRRIRHSDVLDFTGSLEALLRAGLPLAPALAQSATAAPRCAEVIDSLRSRVEKGESFATALRAHPTIFTGVYVGVVAAGERSGDLHAALRRLVVHLESQAALRARLFSAAIYPAILAAVSVAATGFLVGYVIPRFANILVETGVALPTSTRLLITAASGLANAWPLMAALIIACSMTIPAARTSHNVRHFTARALLRLPVLGDLRKHVLAARFGGLCSVMLHGGTPLLAALDDAERSINDIAAAATIRQIRRDVEAGRSMRAALAGAICFPPALQQLVAVGEGAGRLADFLAHAAAVCTESVERRLLRCVMLAEPILILGFGLLVGLVAISLLQAVYSVNSTVTLP